MKIIILLTIMILAGCTTAPKKGQSIPLETEVKKASIDRFDAICYSQRKEKYTLVENLIVVEILEEGIHVRLDSEPEDILIKSGCILENHNSTYKKNGLERPISFLCVFDDIGEVSFRGEEYLLVGSYNQGSIVKLYNPKNKYEYLLSSDQCQIIEDSVK